MTFKATKCETREDFYRQQMYIQKRQERLEQGLSEKDAEVARLKAELAKRENE